MLNPTILLKLTKWFMSRSDPYSRHCVLGGGWKHHSNYYFMLIYSLDLLTLAPGRRLEYMNSDPVSTPLKCYGPSATFPGNLQSREEMCIIIFVHIFESKIVLIVISKVPPIKRSQRFYNFS